jgi:hypothetical protein
MTDKTELMTTTAIPPTDGIDGHTTATVGEETKRNDLFPGARIKFSRESEWEINGEVIDPATRLLLTDVKRICTRWGSDKKPAEPPIVLEPGEPWPPIKQWNDALPRSEWIAGFNGPEGPWRKAQIVHFLDPRTMRRFHWADNSTGGRIAIDDIVGSTKEMRKFRPGSVPVVGLATTFMPTQFGGRDRPHLEIHNWIAMPGGEPQPAALPAPTPSLNGNAAPAIDAEPAKSVPAAKPAKPITALDVAAPLTPVKPVSIAEELDDEIPHL